jgi:hypothetical protein
LKEENLERNEKRIKVKNRKNRNSGRIVLNLSIKFIFPRFAKTDRKREKEMGKNRRYKLNFILLIIKLLLFFKFPWQIFFVPIIHNFSYLS